MARIPFPLSPEEVRDLEKWRKTINFVCPKADSYLVHRTLETELSDPAARYVGTPVRDEFLEARSQRSFHGPVVVSMGHLTPEDLSQVLQGSRLQFLVFGSPRPRKEKTSSTAPLMIKSI